MKKGIFAKFIGQSLRRKLYWAVCILFALTALTVWSVSGVYAKYVDAASVNGSAGVAKMGIATFELMEHELIDISADLDEITGDEINYSSLYDLHPDNTVQNNTYSKVIPGTDIPKDPFINLQLSSNEVSYQLYVVVEENGFIYEDEDGEEYRIPVVYELTEDWKVFHESEDGTTVTYIFTGKLSKVENGVFLAGEGYNFTVDSENGPIQILKDNKIKIGQYFNSEAGIKFSITFTARLEQVINIPVNNPDVGNGTEGNTGNGD